MSGIHDSEAGPSSRVERGLHGQDVVATEINCDDFFGSIKSENAELARIMSKVITPDITRNAMSVASEARFEDTSNRDSERDNPWAVQEGQREALSSVRSLGTMTQISIDSALKGNDRSIENMAILLRYRWDFINSSGLYNTILTFFSIDNPSSLRNIFSKVLGLCLNLPKVFIYNFDVLLLSSIYYSLLRVKTSTSTSPSSDSIPSDELWKYVYITSKRGGMGGVIPGVSLQEYLGVVAPRSSTSSVDKRKDVYIINKFIRYVRLIHTYA